MSVLALIALSLSVTPANRADPLRFEDTGVTVRADLLPELQYAGIGSGYARATWSGQLGDSTLQVAYGVLPPQFHHDEPMEVTDLLEGRLDRFVYDETSVVPGAFGYAPYASVTWGTYSADGRPGEYHAVGAVLPEGSHYFEVLTFPPLSEEHRARVREFMCEVLEYDGPTWDTEWSDEDVEERWLRDAPESVHDKLEKPIRTKHFIVLTNSFSGKTFAKEMEACYSKVRKVFPFEEFEGQRLLPVFLFRDRSEYNSFYAQQFDSTVQKAARSGGVAYHDFYSTRYESPKDPVHLHEVTHQLFGNRLYLDRGGSWFQEGVAEYMETRPNERKNYAKIAAKKGRNMPFEEFVRIPSLLQSSEVSVRGGSAAGDNYKYAASIIEFLRESKGTKKKFLEFIHAAGDAPRNHVAAIQAAAQKVYGRDLAALETEWVKYWK